MTAFLLRRLGWMLLTLWVVFTITFALMRAMPGGPFHGERALEPEVLKNVEARWHLDEPLPMQYLRELGNYLRLDPGPSIKLADFTVGEIIAQGLPVSASLGIVALVLALLLGVTAGVLAAVQRGRLLDSGVMGLATLGISLPDFIIGSVAIIALVFAWPLFPAGGWGSVRQLILPSLCLSLPYAAYIARLTRTGMLEVLSQDYIRTARAKGLPMRTIIFRHALKGAMLPVVSFLGPAVAGILTGSLVIEKIFAIPGLGSHFIEAAMQQDYPLAMGVTMLYTALLYLMNTLVDVAYYFLDPRIKVE